MNAIKELRSTTKMSQSKFATYLGIPVANIQHWEQGVASPPAYLISLISRVMMNDGYLNDDMTPDKIDAIRQTQATLAVENMSLSGQMLPFWKKMMNGKMSREAVQAKIREIYLPYEKH